MCRTSELGKKEAEIRDRVTWHLHTVYRTCTMFVSGVVKERRYMEGYKGTSRRVRGCRREREVPGTRSTRDRGGLQGRGGRRGAARRQQRGNAKVTYASTGDLCGRGSNSIGEWERLPLQTVGLWERGTRGAREGH